MCAAASETPDKPAAAAIPIGAQALSCHGRRRGDRAMPAGLSALALDIAPDDWSELFVAVTQRLRQIADTPPRPATAQTGAPQRWVLPVSSAVLECAQALDQLHASLLAQLAQRQATGETLFERGGYA